MLSFAQKQANLKAPLNKLMEEDISTTSKGSPVMPILGVLGLGIGAIALAVGITALVKVGNAAGEMNDKIERAAALNLEVKKMSDRLDALASQVADMKSGSSTKVDALAKQTQAAVENIGKAINDTRKAVEENRKAWDIVLDAPVLAELDSIFPPPDHKMPLDVL